MRQILVLVTTDHQDNDEAMRAVMNAMDRAGYNQVDYDMGPHVVAKRLEQATALTISSSGIPFLEVVEPEADPRA